MAARWPIKLTLGDTFGGSEFIVALTFTQLIFYGNKIRAHKHRTPHWPLLLATGVFLDIATNVCIHWRPGHHIRTGFESQPNQWFNDQIK